MTELTRDDIRNRIYAVAEERGYQVIEDNLENIVTGLIKRNEKYGGHYCPCRLVKDDDDWKKQITCPCEFLDDEIAENGECHCRLYKKV